MVLTHISAQNRSQPAIDTALLVLSATDRRSCAQSTSPYSKRGQPDVSLIRTRNSSASWLALMRKSEAGSEFTVH